jgi:hypothetical protein
MTIITAEACDLPNRSGTQFDPPNARLEQRVAAVAKVAAARSQHTVSQLRDSSPPPLMACNDLPTSMMSAVPADLREHRV